jgi:hypothetical protein
MPNTVVIVNGVAVDEATGQPVPQPAPEDPVLVKRRKAYPPLADLADALYWQAQGKPGPMNAYLAAVGAVKAKYPKPGE